MPEITKILRQIEQGDSKSSEQLLPLVYDELRRLAAAKMARERPDQTLSATSLVHEAYLRLVDVDQARQWSGRRHFYFAAARAMQRILVEKARRKRRLKRGGGLKREPLDDVAVECAIAQDDLLALDEALQKLAATDPQKAELVRLRYFAGLNLEETAEVLGVSSTTVKRQWRYVRAWVRRELQVDQA